MIIITLMFIILMVVVTATRAKVNNKYEENLWNGGKCPYCGEEWKFFDMNENNKFIYKCKEGHKFTTSQKH